MDDVRTIVLLIFATLLMAAVMDSPLQAQPMTPSELGWPHPIPQLGNTNPPPACTVFANPLSLVVVTDTVTTVTLPGGNGTFLTNTLPMNGTLSGFNSTSGQVTYTAGNTAGSDSFIYCVSNSPTCVVCATVGINLQTLAQITCGACYNSPPAAGGAVTGNIYFNTGVPFEQVCIDYTNTSCTSLSTNCNTTDATGTAKFIVHMCATSSNYCIVALSDQCVAVCYFTHALVFGSNDPQLDGGRADGDYYLQTISFNPGHPPTLTVTLTNSDARDFGNVVMIYNNFVSEVGCNTGNTGAQTGYGNIGNLGDSADYYNFTNNPFGFNCANNGTITGVLQACDGNPQIPVIDFDGVNELTNSCVTICP